MNKEEFLQLNALPEGRAPWLSYDQYLELKRLFETVLLPTETTPATLHVVDYDYVKLHRFLTEIAGLDLPMSEPAIHYNAFALIRRGYKVEQITLTEYEALNRLLEGLEEPDMDDLDLHPTGGHRDLYTYLTQQMGISVQAGRGPAWHRAKMLLDHYEVESQQPEVTGQS